MCNLEERRKKIEEIVGLGPIPWDSFEPGIYNYCDRWCEKCPNAEKCFLFYNEEKEKEESKKQGKNINSMKSSLDYVKSSFDTTLQLIETISEEENIDLNSDGGFNEQEWERLKEVCNPDNEPLMLMAQKLFEELGHINETIIKSVQVNNLKERIEYFDYHSFFFLRKTSRAIRSKLEAQFEDSSFREFNLEDCYKTALLVHRSITICKNILGQIHEEYPDLPFYNSIQNCQNFLTCVENELFVDYFISETVQFS